MTSGISRHVTESDRHRTAWREAGPADGRLMIFLHGWPELGLVWDPQLAHFAARGWRCIAPDMRGYGGSLVPSEIAAYGVREIVAGMIELHDALGGTPAVWVGHDWGAPIAWGIAAHHAERCLGVAGICVSYFARGLTLDALVPLVDRAIYPIERFPVGQWDYWLYHREQFERSACDLEANVANTIATLYRRAKPRVASEPAAMAGIRANSGWFGSVGVAPTIPRDQNFMSQTAFDTVVQAFAQTGFRGANAWYLNDAPNAAFAAEAPNFGRLSKPTLFIHATEDAVCDTLHTRLAEPMREACANLTEMTVQCGHTVSLEAPAALNTAIEHWVAEQGVGIA
ncbi:alpha/beta hydrolase [Sphingomonas sp. MMS24-J13]|uniref:alpha/beta hydrolase n=1 Tax=Sphingomonas sp. MMS24-J13 TaxID=3238686 RepID=UPI00384CAD19